MSFSTNQHSNAILPPVIMNLLIANGMMFFFQSFFKGNISGLLLEQFALWPFGIEYWKIWQPVTYGFMHGNIAHLFFNMLALWMFGREIEIRWGSARFASYYFFCVIGAGLVQLLVSTMTFRASGMIYPTLGASGGTCGILLAFGMLFPYRRILLLIPPIPIEARFFVIFFGLFELFSGLTGFKPGIAHFAHLGGMFFGLMLILYWRGKLPFKPRHRMYW